MNKSLYIVVDDQQGTFYDAIEAADAQDAWRIFYKQYPTNNDNLSMYLKVRRVEQKDLQTIHPIAHAASQKR